MAGEDEAAAAAAEEEVQAAQADWRQEGVSKAEEEGVERLDGGEVKRPAEEEAVAAQPPPPPPPQEEGGQQQPAQARDEAEVKAEEAPAPEGERDEENDDEQQARAEAEAEAEAGTKRKGGSAAAGGGRPPAKRKKRAGTGFSLKRGKGKGKARSKGRDDPAAAPAAAAAAANGLNGDNRRLVPVPKSDDDTPEGRSVVRISSTDKAVQVELSEDRLTASSIKGYRAARATRGVHEGSWYFEIQVLHLGDTGHVRLGWSTPRADLQTPVGFDSGSYAYRDLEGSKVSAALREPYGEQYGEGDVVGCYIHIPHGAQPPPKRRPTTIYKGEKFYVIPPEDEQKTSPPDKLKGSMVAFFKNGVYQGVAYTDLEEGEYFPAASMYTMPNPNKPAAVRFNFGPSFQHPPQMPEDLPAFRPISDLAIPLPAVHSQASEVQTAAQTDA